MELKQEGMVTTNARLLPVAIEVTFENLIIER